MTPTVHTNHKCGRNFLVIAWLTIPASLAYKRFRKWLLRCLENVDHPSTRTKYGRWVWGAVGSPWVDHVYARDRRRPLNKVVFAIRLGEKAEEQLDDLGLVILEEASTYGSPHPVGRAGPPHSCSLLSTETIAAVMKSQGLPQFLCSVGISAVTDDTLSRWWKEIIGEKKQWLGTESGGGYMAHPMYVKWGPAKGDEREWVSVNERSFNFGWQNYPE